MSGFQQVIINGAIGKQPELSYTQGGMAMCKFSVATSKKKKNGEEVTSWHSLTAWGKTAEVIAQHFSKGDGIFVTGELVYGQYEKDGIKRYTTDIFVTSFTFPVAKKSAASQGGQASQPQQKAFNMVDEQAFGGQFNSSMDDDEIPF